MRSTFFGIVDVESTYLDKGVRTPRRQRLVTGSDRLSLEGDVGCVVRVSTLGRVKS